MSRVFFWRLDVRGAERWGCLAVKDYGGLSVYMCRCGGFSGGVLGFRLWLFYICMILLGSKLGFLQTWQKLHPTLP